MNAIITAIRTLTILPVPGKDARRFADALLFFPLVGALLAGLLWIVYHGCGMLPSLPHSITALVLTAAATILTGALHVDGVADVADAFGGGRTKDRVLEILKDSRHGTFGVCAIVFVLLGKLLLYDGFVVSGTFVPVVLAIVTSRTLQAVMLAFLPNARKETSVASGFAGGTFHKVAICLMLAAVSAGSWFLAGGWSGVLAVAVAIACCAIFTAWCMKRIGGITGDCVGAANEIAELAVMLSMTVAAKGLQ